MHLTWLSQRRLYSVSWHLALALPIADVFFFFCNIVRIGCYCYIGSLYKYVSAPLAVARNNFIICVPLDVLSITWCVCYYIVILVIPRACHKLLWTNINNVCIFSDLATFDRAESQVSTLVKAASSHDNLCRMDPAWHPWLWDIVTPDIKLDPVNV